MSGRKLHSIPSVDAILQRSEPFEIPRSITAKEVVKVSLVHYGRLATKRGYFSLDPNQTHEAQQYTCQQDFKVPVFGALIEKNGSFSLWDLGNTQHPEVLSPMIKVVLDKVFIPTDLVPGAYAPAILEKAQNLHPGKFVERIFISHGHSDHFGDLTAFDKTIPIIYGPGSRDWLLSGTVDVEAPPEYVNFRDIIEVGDAGGYGIGSNKSWQKIGPFEKGWDYFNDGSLWLIPSPGHCPGHQIALCRVNTNPDSYVALVGDAAHSQSHYSPVKPNSTFGILGKIKSPFDQADAEAVHSAFTDIDAAYGTIAKLIQLNQKDNIMLCSAHEYELELALEMEPGDISGDLSNWQSMGLKKQKAKLH